VPTICSAGYRSGQKLPITMPSCFDILSKTKLPDPDASHSRKILGRLAISLKSSAYMPHCSSLKIWSRSSIGASLLNGYVSTE